MKKLLAVICTMSVLFLSGCSMMSLDGSDIMCPPKATGSNAVIQKLIDKQTSR
jgi:protein involved in sex pheromone biosynthesis